MIIANCNLYFVEATDNGKCKEWEQGILNETESS